MFSPSFRVRGVLHPLVYVDDGVAGRTAMLHVLTGVHTEWDAAAEETPEDGEAAADGPRHEASTVLGAGDH